MKRNNHQENSANSEEIEKYLKRKLRNKKWLKTIENNYEIGILPNFNDILVFPTFCLVKISTYIHCNYAVMYVHSPLKIYQHLYVYFLKNTYLLVSFLKSRFSIYPSIFQVQI